jgi:hypothetical protein
LRDHVVCNPSFVASSYSSTQDRLLLFDNSPAPGQPIYDSRGTSSAGFTNKGAVCNTFSATGAGNDDCPIGYFITWYLSSGGNNNGVSMTITAKLVFNPSDSHPMKNLINAAFDNNTLGNYDVSATQNVSSFLNTNVPTCELNGVTIANTGSYPFYTTDSVPLGERCISQMRTCNVFNNTPVLSGTATYTTCAQDCVGYFTDCSKSCGGGNQIYTVVLPANQWGVACPYPDGLNQACNLAPCP